MWNQRETAGYQGGLAWVTIPSSVAGGLRPRGMIDHSVAISLDFVALTERAWGERRPHKETVRWE